MNKWIFCFVALSCAVMPSQAQNRLSNDQLVGILKDTVISEISDPTQQSNANDLADLILDFSKRSSVPDCVVDQLMNALRCNLDYALRKEKLSSQAVDGAAITLGQIAKNITFDDVGSPMVIEDDAEVKDPPPPPPGPEDCNAKLLLQKGARFAIPTELSTPGNLVLEFGKIARFKVVVTTDPPTSVKPTIEWHIPEDPVLARGLVDCGDGPEQDTTTCGTVDKATYESLDEGVHVLEIFVTFPAELPMKGAECRDRMNFLFARKR